MAVASVVCGASYSGAFPARPQVLRAHLGARLEAAARKNDRAAIDLVLAVRVPYHNAGYWAAGVAEQPHHLGLIEYLDAVAPGGSRQHPQQSGTAIAGR